MSSPSRPPKASAYSRARSVASCAAAIRTWRYTGLSGRSDHHGPATLASSSVASRDTSSPSTVKSRTVRRTLAWPE